MANPATLPPIAVAQWPLIYQTARDIFARYAGYFWPADNDRAQATLQLIAISSRIREYAVTAAKDLQEPWEMLREENLMVDCVMAVGGDLYMEIEATVDQLAQALASSIHSLLPPASEENKQFMVMDGAFIESVGQIEDLAKLFRQNRWFLTLAILRRAGVFSLASLTKE